MTEQRNAAISARARDVAVQIKEGDCLLDEVCGGDA
jgi:hypothetical protein